MSVISIHKRKHQYSELVSKFKATRSLDDLINSLEHCLQYTQADFWELEKSWCEKHQIVLHDSDINPFLEFVAKIDVVYPKKDRADFADPNVQDPSKQIVLDIFESVSESQRVKDQKSKEFSWFHPTIMVGEILSKICEPELNPVPVISRYLAVLFPDELSPEQLEQADRALDIGKRYSIEFKSSIHKFMIKVGEELLSYAVVDSVEKNALLCCLYDVLDPDYRESYEITVRAEDIVFHALFTPPKFFYAWYDCWVQRILSCNDNLDINHRFDVPYAMLSYITFGKGGRGVDLPTFVINEKHRQKLIDHQNTLAYDKYLPLADLFDVLWTLYDIGVFDHEREEVAAIFKAQLDQFTAYRRENLAGVFPARNSCAGMIGSTIDSLLPIEDCDVLLLLAGGYYEHAVISCGCFDHRLSALEKTECLNKVQHYYLVVYNKLLQEALPELAVAMLTNYLYLRCFWAKGRFGSMPELMPAVCQALSLPGAKVLKHAITLIVKFTEDQFSDDPIAAGSVAYFRPYISQAAELHLLEGGTKKTLVRKSSESEVLSSYEEMLGTERWHKLSLDSQNCLVSAELLWRNSAVEFGFGIKDWSGYITTCCKAIEGELVERLRDFFESQEYDLYLAGKGFTKPTKPTAGWLLKELKFYEQMPPELKAVLDATKIQLIEKKELVGHLLDIVNNYRNVAAHPAITSARRFAEFKEKLFQGGLLQRFIDAFVE